MVEVRATGKEFTVYRMISFFSYLQPASWAILFKKSGMVVRVLFFLVCFFDALLYRVVYVSNQHKKKDALKQISRVYFPET